MSQLNPLDGIPVLGPDDPFAHVYPADTPEPPAGWRRIPVAVRGLPRSEWIRAQNAATGEIRLVPTFQVTSWRDEKIPAKYPVPSKRDRRRRSGQPS